MVDRRDFMQMVTTMALVVPGLPLLNFEKGRLADLKFPAEGDPDYWRKIRHFFTLPLERPFFNTATLGSPPAVVLEAVIQHMQQVAASIADWDYKAEDWIAGYQPWRDLRAKLAELAGAAPEEVAMTENATMGMNLVASGLDLKPGDEVLITDQEHPGGRCGWDLKAKRFGVVVTPVPLPRPPREPAEIVDLFRSAMTSRTRVLAVPHIVSGYGTILPVKELCSEASRRGIFTAIDGAQAFGHIAVNLKDLGCDAYFTCLHKWFLAPVGTGFLYVRKEKIRDVWTTLASSQWDNQEDGGYRLGQRGTGNLSLLAGLNAAIEFHRRIGPQRIFQRIKFLGDFLRQGLKSIPGVTIHTPLHPEMAAGTTNYEVAGLDSIQLQDELWKRKKIRIRGNRQSTHIYNFPEEIEATLEVVRALAKK